MFLVVATEVGMAHEDGLHVVVGAGPLGLAVARELRRTGEAVRVVTRGGTLNDLCGIDPVLPLGHRPPLCAYVWPRQLGVAALRPANVSRPSRAGQVGLSHGLPQTFEP
jgi:hypothetical protein